MSAQDTLETVQRILEDRARLLAQPLPEMVSPGDRRSFLVCTLGQDRWAFPAAAVLAVVPLSSLAAVPAAPPGVAGVANYRGEIVSVIDIGPCFGLPPRDARAAGVLVLVEHAEGPLALVVDTVLGLHETTPTEVAPVPPGVAMERKEYLMGLLPPAATAILDLDHLLGDLRLLGDGEASP